jgi:hypothetical protein
VFGIPIDFLRFAATLTGVALLHKHVLKVALTGLATITLYKLLFFGAIAARQQHGHQPISREVPHGATVDYVRLAVVAAILLSTIVANIYLNLRHPEVLDRAPVIGLAVVLALKQGGYDWGMLAYVVGFGGSMIWFGSSTGVALASFFPEARSVGYLIGFAVLMAVIGWHPEPLRRDQLTQPATAAPAQPAASR